MNEKETYQEISFVLEQGRKDLRRCLNIIEKHGAEIQDIFRHYGVIGAVVPSCEILKIEEELRAHRIAVQLHHGVILQELEEENSDPIKYSAVIDDEDISISRRRKHLLTEDIAIWYAFQFERQRIKKENLMPFLTLGKPFDIITAEPAWDHPAWEPEASWFPHFILSMRLIIVVGQRYKGPHNFTLPDDITREHSPKLGKLIENTKYYVYYIYNLNMGSHPRLVILNSLFLRKHYKELEWREIAIHNVAKGIKVNEIKIHKLPRYTESVQRMVRSFFRVEYE
jgi:hypothetical protein